MGAAWSAAAAGEPAVLLIVGEAGIGKTRLAREAIAVAESTGGLVLQARCYAAERSLFLQPFVDALAGLVATMRPDRLRELTGARAAAFAGLLPAAGQVFGPPPVGRAAPEAELRRAFEGVTACCRGLAAQRTLLLVLDDLQNAGRATVDLLHYLARHARAGAAARDRHDPRRAGRGDDRRAHRCRRPHRARPAAGGRGVPFGVWRPVMASWPK